MKSNIDIGSFINVRTKQQVVADLVLRIQQRRKELKISRKQLAVKTARSYSSIRRFEETGECSFSLLLDIAHAIGYLEDFDKLFTRMAITNLKDFKVWLKMLKN